MAQTAGEIQKERIREIEEKASRLLEKCEIVTLASVNEKGYPRICAVSKLAARDFHEIFFVTSKRSERNGKAVHFERNPKASVCYTAGGDSVTLIGTVEFIEDRAERERLWNEADRKFFSKGIDDPKFRLLKFHTIEATFWIEGRFRTCRYR